MKTTTYLVTFKNHLNELGETYESPTDFLNPNGATILDFSYVESDIRDSENFARETWEYEVDNADLFENGLDLSSTVIEYKQICCANPKTNNNIFRD